MNDYEMKKQARIDRYRARAVAARKLASHLLGDTPEQKTLRGMAGEPVKIGHHSERRHRRLIEKCDRQMRKGSEEFEKAKYYDDRADGAESNGAISSDDPEALAKLRERLAELESEQSSRKAINAAYKKYRKNPASLASSGLSDSEMLIIRNFNPEKHFQPCPFPAYSMQNKSANIRRVKQRIEQLEKLAALPQTRRAIASGEGWEVVADVPDNRLWFVFDAIPSPDARKVLKQRGFKWSPTRKAYVRGLNGGSRDRAREVINILYPDHWN